MKSNFTSKDEQYMKIALEESVQALSKGNFPCGAVLVVNNEIFGKSQNQKESKKDRVSHAEMLLYIEHSSLLKTAKKQGHTITMYTTLEPCLMCFGSAAMHRVDRIVAATPDPFGNMSKVEGKELGQFYTNLPKLEYGLCFKESFDLISDYLLKADTDESREYLKLFEGVRTKYEN
jgi:tRNA(Arg) A34 adenosine deaminase TadA